jgi:hypothetical protein
VQGVRGHVQRSQQGLALQGLEVGGFKHCWRLRGKKTRQNAWRGV